MQQRRVNSVENLSEQPFILLHYALLVNQRVKTQPDAPAARLQALQRLQALAHRRRLVFNGFGDFSRRETVSDNAVGYWFEVQ